MAFESESTATLLLRVKEGDEAARERLCTLYLPILSRWAHGRLPEYARDTSETDDMVQLSLMKALDKLETFNPVREGAFLAYLRKILLNNIRNEIRKVSRQGNKVDLSDHVEIVDEQSSVVEKAVGAEIIEKYEKALTHLNEQSREAVMLRVEFGFSYLEVAAAIDCNSANAARMIVTRALIKLAELM
ncbi:RNA polymerase sigma factor [Marinicella sp. W31]|uniref:RNA polymerase sigma factor n=1 Tax=Marinicella sp. W31 TaxID=3023713 RepID=UPI0037584151